MKAKKKIPAPLPEVFHRMVETSINAKGVFPHLAVWLDQDRKLCMGSLHLNQPHQVMGWVAATLASGAVELVYGLDRFARPGQGTTLGDLIAGAWFTGRDCKPFVIEYQHEPRIVKPIDWGNEFWSRSVGGELIQSGLIRQVAAEGGAA
ncbi:MAG: hypothetical protein KF873_02150 [Gemmataceae bacterium]|nr:hypothetical protein [Gemmataceae bacterium]